MSVLVDFSRGGIEWRWWACLCAGALKGVGPPPGVGFIFGMVARCNIGEEDGWRV